MIFGGVLLGVWFSLGSSTKCKLIYGKNICNYYEMVDLFSPDPESPDFQKAMQLCRDMDDVPKKDSCFEYIAQEISLYDLEKAREVCGEIKGFDQVTNKENCYLFIEKPEEERLAESVVVAFIEARIQRDEELALAWLTDNAKEGYFSHADLPITGLSNPHFADFEILERKKLNDRQFLFTVRIYEKNTGSQNMVGYFDETLTVLKEDDNYLVDSFIRSEYTNY